MDRYLLYDLHPWPLWEPRRAKSYLIPSFQDDFESSSSVFSCSLPKCTFLGPSPPYPPDPSPVIVRSHRHVLSPTALAYVPPTPKDSTPAPDTDTPSELKPSSSPSSSSDTSVSSYVSFIQLYPTRLSTRPLGNRCSQNRQFSLPNLPPNGTFPQHIPAHSVRAQADAIPPNILHREGYPHIFLNIEQLPLRRNIPPLIEYPLMADGSSWAEEDDAGPARIVVSFWERRRPEVIYHDPTKGWFDYVEWKWRTDFSKGIYRKRVGRKGGRGKGKGTAVDGK